MSRGGLRGKKHTAANGLSRCRGTPEERTATENDEETERVEEFIDDQLFSSRIIAEKSSTGREGAQHKGRINDPTFVQRQGNLVTAEVDRLLEKEFYVSRVTAGPALFDASILEVRLKRGVYDEEWEQIGRYLESLRRPEGMGDEEFKMFKRKATRFLIRDGLLYIRGRVNEPPRKVVVKEEEKIEALRELHDNSGHRGREGKLAKVGRRYWWPG